MRARLAQSGALVKIDCAALPSELLEAELFGYERGAFTGATEARPGRLEAAHKGTLCLDEIAHLSVDAQAKLLRVIEQREFERLGGRRTIKVDARLIALTNVDLDDAVRRRAFREDLFYRLNVVRLTCRRCSERREDIEKLARSFLKTYATKHGRSHSDLRRTLLPFSRLTSGRATCASSEHHRARGDRGERTRGLKRRICRKPYARRSCCRSERKQRQTLAELEADYIIETLAAAKATKRKPRACSASVARIFTRSSHDIKTEVRCQMLDDSQRQELSI